MKVRIIWKFARVPVFIALLVILVVIDQWVTRARLNWIFGYLSVLVLFIAFVHYRYKDKKAPESQPVWPEGTPPFRKGLPLFELLLEEFEYIKETASQAMNDRHTMINYFLLSAGVVIAGIGAVASKDGAASFPFRNQSLVALCLLFNAIGWLYFLQIVRLRQAWCESARAMNHLKEFYARHCDLPFPLASRAFRWNMKSIPPAAKKTTVFYLSALLISVISAGALALATGIMLGDERLRELFYYPGLLAVFHILFQMSMYTALLEETPVPKDAAEGTPFAPFTPTSGEVRLVEEKVVFDDFFKVIAARLRFEKFSGELSNEVRRLCFERGDSVAGVLHNPESNTILLIEQFRYPVYKAEGHAGGWLLEIVAGTTESGETPEQVLNREALEETGYAIRNIQPLAVVYPSPGGTSERQYLFYAVLARRENAGGGAAHEHEDIRVLEFPARQVYEMIAQGELHDAKTILALLLARERIFPG